MTPFHYSGGALHVEGVSLAAVAAQVGTPCYVYSRRRIEDNWRAYDDAFGDHPHCICYAVKANGTLAVLDVLARLGSGFDIVSGGELARVELAGGAPSTVVFSGVGKSGAEIEAALNAGVGCIDVESLAEIDRVADVATRLQVTAPLAVRVNPDVDPETHPYIATGLKTSKFGIDIEHALETYQYAARQPGIAIRGVACHIGSQMMTTAPLLDAFNRLLDLVEMLRAHDIAIEHIDAGGGLGVGAADGPDPDKVAWIHAMLEAMDQRGVKLPIYIEPGRSIVGDAGVLLTRVEYIKSNGDRRFAVIDAGMNDLLRPALYQARHEMVTVKQHSEPGRLYDVVGPVCESADVMGTDRRLAVEAGDLVAITGAGAYGAVMASNYNARPRPAEVLVDGHDYHLARRRETLEDMTALETLLPSTNPRHPGR